jgi:hypothetical protein
LWWASPTYEQARIGARLVAALAQSAGILLRDTTRPPLYVSFINGGYIEFRSWERAQNLFGPTIAGAVIDEFGELTDEAYGALSSRRSGTLGPFKFYGNPGLYQGIAEDIFKRAQSGDDPEATAFTWSWRHLASVKRCACAGGQAIPVDLASSKEPKKLEGLANQHESRCPRGKYIRFVVGEARRLPLSEFLRLYEAYFIDFGALPCYDFAFETNVTKAVMYQPVLPLRISFDFNVEPFCATISQVVGKHIYVFDELAIWGGINTKGACQEIISRYGKHRSEIIVHGDVSGTYSHTSASETDYQIILNELRRKYKYVSLEIHDSESEDRRNPSHKDRVNAVNAALKPAIGPPRLHIHPRCKTLIKDLQKVSWKPGTRQIDKETDKRITHASDALGYMIEILFPVKGESGTKTDMAPLPKTDIREREY